MKLREIKNQMSNEQITRHLDNETVIVITNLSRACTIRDKCYDISIFSDDKHFQGGVHSNAVQRT